jgi:CBS domain-containing protein
MQIQDLMNRDVIVVFEFTLFKDMVELIERERVTALPVVDHRRPIGIVSEFDLLLKADHDRLSSRRWPAIGGRRRAENRKARAICARTLMTSPAIVIGPDASASEAARRMLAHGVRCLPVVDRAGRLIGIVSRGDVLKVFTRPDDAIKHEIENDVLRWTMLLGNGQVKVSVRKGTVNLNGLVDRRTEVAAIQRIVARVDGVVEVIANLDFKLDDTSLGNVDMWASGGSAWTSWPQR